MAELAHSLLCADGASPTQWLLVLHGILGRRSNLRTLSKKLVEACPSWGAVLVDLRCHGDSQPMNPPHSIESASQDLDALITQVPGPITGVLGHSFGGKVAMHYAAAHQDQVRTLWVLDAPPSERDVDYRDASLLTRVLNFLNDAPWPVATRQDFVQQGEKQGFSTGLMQWLAMNLRQNDDQAYVLNFDLGAIRSLLSSYYTLNLWPALEALPLACVIHFVVGENSEIFDAQERARATDIVARHANMHLHLLPDAGHWLHVDAPEALQALINHHHPI